MTRHRIILVMLIAMVTNGCSQASPPIFEHPTTQGTETQAVEITSLSPTATITPAKTATAMPTPSATMTFPAIPPQPTNTPTTTPEAMQYQCLEILPSLPTNAEVSGIIITHGYGPEGETALLNMESGTVHIIPEPEDVFNLDLIVSPDRRWLAYHVSSHTLGGLQLVVTGADGQPAQTIPWQENWFLISGWLDNERLLITERPGDETFGSLTVINPFTREQMELLPNFPGIVMPFFTYINWGEFSFSGMIYDPTLTRVLYPKSGTYTNEIVLWDVQNQQRIEAIPTLLTRTTEPKWSPDGNAFAVAHHYTDGNSEMLIIGRDGGIDQVTQLSDYSLADIGTFNWSPDGSQIALWLKAAPSQYRDQRLVVLDIITHRLINYCVPGSFQGDSSPPIWSPDGHQLVVENYLGDNERRVILVDIVQGYAAQISEDVSPFGWMASP